ncbi:MAG: hypothetical protein ACOY4T_03790 [Pseudomonadota bacterium]|jgi:hypothetical protein
MTEQTPASANSAAVRRGGVSGEDAGGLRSITEPALGPWQALAAGRGILRPMAG